MLNLSLSSTMWLKYLQIKFKNDIINGLTFYSQSVDLNKFGGRFKYSKVLNVIDQIDETISSNITRVRIRRNLKACNQSAQYELSLVMLLI